MSEIDWAQEGLQPFDPVRVYDKPSAILGQLVEDGPSLDGLMRTIFSPEKLSPHEREGMVGRLKKSMGTEDGVGGFIVDVALNPFTWMLMMTSPAIPRVFSAGARGAKWVMGAPAPKGKMGAFLNGVKGLLGAVGLTGGLERTRGSGLDASLLAYTKAIQDLRVRQKEIFGDIYDRTAEAVSKHLGRPVRDLDWRSHSDPEVRRFLRKMAISQEVVTHGLDTSLRTMPSPRVAPRTFVTVQDPAAPGQMKQVEIKDERHARAIKEALEIWTADQNLLKTAPAAAANTNRVPPPVIEMWDPAGAGRIHVQVHGVTSTTGTSLKQAGLDPQAKVQHPLEVTYKGREEAGLFRGEARAHLKELEALGIPVQELMQKRADYYRDAYVRHFADEAAYQKTGKLVVDQEKAYRVYRHYEGAGKPDSAIWGPEGLSEIEMLVHRDLEDLVRAGHLSRAEFMGAIQTHLMWTGTGRTYAPMNVRVVLDAAGKEVPWEEWKVQKDKGRARSPASPRIAAPRGMDSPTYSPEMLRFILKEYRLSPDAEATVNLRLSQAEAKLRKGRDDGDPYVAFHEFNPETSIRQYSAEDERLHGLVSHPLTAAELEAEDLASKERPIAEGRRRRERQAVVEGQKQPDDPMARSVKERIATGDAPPGGVTRWDLLQRGKLRLAPDDLREYERVIEPRLLGTLRMNHMLSWYALRAGQKVLKGVYGGGLAKYIGGQVPWFEKHRKDMVNLAEWDVPISHGRKVSSDAAHYLYAVYLSNPVTIGGNLLQPLGQAGAILGYPTIMQGYVRAFKRLGRYMVDRVKLGLRPDQMAVRNLILKHYPYAEHTGMVEDLVDAMEGSIPAQPTMGKEGWKGFLLKTLPLKFFGLSERVNRSVTAEAVMLRHEKHAKQHGLPMPSMDEMADDIHQLVGMTQMAGHSSLSMPTLFQGGQDDGFMTRVLDNPLVRMMYSFRARTLTGLMVGTNQVGTGTRTFGVGPLKTEIPATLGDLFRMLGAGAIFYEAVKNMAGADISKWLGPGTVSQSMDPAGYVSTPIFTLPQSVWRDVSAGEMGDLFRDVIPRMVPGGPFLQNALGSLPQLPLVGGLQKTYADWSNPRPDGTIPVFKEDGSLINFESPTGLVVRGLGFRTDQWGDDTELSKFMLQNGQQIKDYRRRFVSAHLAGNPGLAETIKDEFETRFQVPLVVKPEQWKQAEMNRQIPIQSRILRGFNQDVRGQYQPFLDPRQVVVQAMRAKEEEEGGSGSPHDVGRVLQDAQGRVRRGAGFDSFSTFN